MHLILRSNGQKKIVKLDNFCHIDFRGYFPPEVFRDGHWGPEVDVYATGMCVIHLLSGCQPYGELDDENFVLDALLRVFVY